MALTQQQLDATRRYKAGEITSDQYKQAYVTNYDPTKDKSFGKNIAYSGTSSPEAIRIQENSQALIDAMQPKPAVPVQPVPQMVQPVQAPKTDYLGMISSQYGEATNSAVAKLKQAIAESKAKQQGIIGNAPKQFDPLRSQSELAKGQQLRSVLERNSLMGDRGGVGRSAALQTQTAGENRLNSINLQQQEVIDTANQEIANLESRGLYEEANIRSQQKLAELQALMAESQRQDEIARRSAETLDTRAYNDSIRGQEYAREDAQTAEERARQDFGATIMANYNDISAFANRLEASGAPQWQIDQARAAVIQKRADLNLDKLGKPIPVDNTQQVWDAAYKKWNAGIPLTQQEMGVIGATTPTKPKVVSSGSSSGSRTTITQDRNYQEDRWQRLGKADQAIADAWGVPVGTPFSNKPEETTQADIGEYDDYINTYYRTSTDGVNSVDKNGIAIYLVELEKAGKSDEAIELAIKYNISDKTIEEAERILNSRR
ncbi:MAG TPA: hypothetical protein VLS94_08975 [Fusibacter sp.]|nr:hypothetical protein [Fusibacter sp.]